MIGPCARNRGEAPVNLIKRDDGCHITVQSACEILEP